MADDYPCAGDDDTDPGHGGEGWDGEADGAASRCEVYVVLDSDEPQGCVDRCRGGAVVEESASQYGPTSKSLRGRDSRMAPDGVQKPKSEG